MSLETKKKAKSDNFESETWWTLIAMANSISNLWSLTVRFHLLRRYFFQVYLAKKHDHLEIFLKNWKRYWQQTLIQGDGRREGGRKFLQSIPSSDEILSPEISSNFIQQRIAMDETDDKIFNAWAV